MIHDAGLEQNVLGAIMYLRGAGEAVEEVLEKLTPKDFFSQKNRQVFLAIQEIASSGCYPDHNMVSEHRFCTDLFVYVLEIAKNTVSGMNLIKNADSLRDLTNLRMIQDRVNQVNDIIANSNAITEKLVDIENIFSLETGLIDTKVYAKHISECMPKFIDRLEQRWNDRDSVIFSTGIPELDKILDGGFEVGLHAIAARPKTGKTELMVKMINHVAVDRKMPVLLASLEMEDYQVIERSVSAIGHVDKSLIKNNFDPEMAGSEDPELLRDSFNVACRYLYETNLYIDDRHANKTSIIRREAKKIVKKHGSIGGIYVDYLTLLAADGKYDRHDLAVASMTRDLKGMSKEFGCPVILLLQLNRDAEKRTDKRPVASDSRDSGAIEQDVDSWIGLYRDSVYYPDSEWGMITEIIVRLNRHGETGTAYQMLTGHGFVDVDPEVVSRVESKSASKVDGAAIVKQQFDKW